MHLLAEAGIMEKRLEEDNSASRTVPCSRRTTPLGLEAEIPANGGLGGSQPGHQLVRRNPTLFTDSSLTSNCAAARPCPRFGGPRRAMSYVQGGIANLLRNVLSPGQGIGNNF